MVGPAAARGLAEPWVEAAPAPLAAPEQARRRTYRPEERATRRTMAAAARSPVQALSQSARSRRSSRRLRCSSAGAGPLEGLRLVGQPSKRSRAEVALAARAAQIAS